MPDYGATERVKRVAVETYIEPARRRGEKTVEIHSGQLARDLVQRQMLQPNRFPIVCNALRSKRFSIDNHVTLEEVRTSAASGQSSTVTFVFRLDDVRGPGAGSLASLRGIMKKSYRKLGGAESFHRSEREAWDK